MHNPQILEAMIAELEKQGTSHLAQAGINAREVCTRLLDICAGAEEPYEMDDNLRTQMALSTITGAMARMRQMGGPASIGEAIAQSARSVMSSLSPEYARLMRRCHELLEEECFYIVGVRPGSGWGFNDLGDAGRFAKDLGDEIGSLLDGYADDKRVSGPPTEILVDCFSSAGNRLPGVVCRRRFVFDPASWDEGSAPYGSGTYRGWREEAPPPL